MNASANEMKNVNHSPYSEQHAALQRQRSELIVLIREKEKEIDTQIKAGGEERSSIDMNHPADMVLPDQDHEKSIALLHRSRVELAMVDRALFRINTGDYGQCEECGGEINYRRLVAIPYTGHCIDCSKELEANEDRPDLRSYVSGF